jgi:Ca2+-binding EF-hand superfamily protein
MAMRGMAMRGMAMLALTLAFFLALMLSVGPGAAQDARVGALPPDVPEKTVKRMRDAPDAFLIDAFDMILGYGEGEGIDAAGIDRFIAVDRADARAKMTAYLMAADLNADGTVDSAEIAVLVQARAARQRGRLMQDFNAADKDGDGTVTGAEIVGAAAAAAGDAVSPAKAAALRAMMTLDLDKDRVLTVDEVIKAVKLAQDAA